MNLAARLVSCVVILGVGACSSEGSDTASTTAVTGAGTEGSTGVGTTGGGATSNGSAPSTTAMPGSDGGTGGANTGAAGSDAGTGADGSGTTTGASVSDCDDPGLAWHSGNKTNYESYPDPGSEECVVYHGCDYVGMFEACANTMPEDWVMAHDIASVFPLGDLALHRLCIRSGDTTMIVTAIDTCADSDCDGCCTENRGDADALIDLEKYTNERFGIEDGAIEWADLGPGDPSFDGCN